eukprot:TRINITY_DN1544_c0_g1_i2.p3 TRINITY_DN1544_c0_g1~~TRINITY_DN1544_c0_g1_i2.p3  ORF type:complete len:56 (-),score=9.10 TRINITY_DN1544_c0_g1_i2:627-794(-)
MCCASGGSGPAAPQGCCHNTSLCAVLSALKKKTNTLRHLKSNGTTPCWIVDMTHS